MKERVMLFIDGNNFYHGCRNTLGRSDVDFPKLAALLAGDRKLIRIYYYNAPLDRDEDEERYLQQQKFFETMRRLPLIDVRLGRLVQRGNTYVEKGIDLAIAIDMLDMAHRNCFDTAVLITGDGDFTPLIETVKMCGKQVEVAYFSKGFSNFLQDSADKVTYLDEHSHKISRSPCEANRATL